MFAKPWSASSTHGSGWRTSRSGSRSVWRLVQDYLALFLLAAMTWDDLFARSSLWELSLFLFVLAVFVASPLALFVIGRPLKVLTSGRRLSRGREGWVVGLAARSPISHHDDSAEQSRR
jgi:small-conductance mechanosensitive channel